MSAGSIENIALNQIMNISQSSATLTEVILKMVDVIEGQRTKIAELSSENSELRNRMPEKPTEKK